LIRSRPGVSSCRERALEDGADLGPAGLELGVELGGGQPQAAGQRRAILLREWQGLSYAEIADELQLSVGAVEALLFRARRGLTSCSASSARRNPA